MQYALDAESQSIWQLVVVGLEVNWLWYMRTTQFQSYSKAEKSFPRLIALAHNSLTPNLANKRNHQAHYTCLMIPTYFQLCSIPSKSCSQSGLVGLLPQEEAAINRALHESLLQKKKKYTRRRPSVSAATIPPISSDTASAPNKRSLY